MSCDYVFVDRKCPICSGEGFLELMEDDTKYPCKVCNGTGLVGSYEEVEVPEYTGTSAFAHRLRKTREVRKVSMADLAGRFNLTVVELSDIERGRVEPIGELRHALGKWVYERK